MTGTPPTSRRTPERTSAQRLAALQRANETRSARARIKNQLRTGEVEISALLAAPPDSLLTAKLEELLLALPQYGPARTRTILAHCRISSSKTVGGLTPRQRQALLNYLGGGSGC